jgi:hypothetical protein
MYQMPKLIGEKGNMHFRFETGEKSKTIYFVGKFDEFTGEYPIYDENNQLVEYMDILGNFSKEKTELAECLYRHAIQERIMPVVAYAGYYTYFRAAIIDFPSKFLVDEKVRDAILKEERRKYNHMVSTHQFCSLLDRLSYKIYANQVIKAKLKKAQKLKQEQLNAEQVTETSI